MSSCAYLGLTRSVCTHGLSSKLFLVQFSSFHGDQGLHRGWPMTQAVKADGFLNPGPRNWCGVTSAISSPCLSSVQFSSVAQSCLTLCNPMNHSTPGPPSITNSRSSLKLVSIKSVMPSSPLILCRPLLLLPPIPPSIRVFSNESTLRIR